MSKSASRTARLLEEIPYLLSHQGITLDQMAQEFDITPEEASKDVHVIALCGLPGGFPGDLMDVDYDALDEGFVYLSNVPLKRPLRLSLAEAMSLHLALATLRAGVDDKTRITIDSVLSKVSQGAPEPLEVKVCEGEAKIRQDIHRAIHGAQRIELTYEGQARGITTYPVVDPGSLVVVDGALFLHGFCLRSRQADNSSIDDANPGWRRYRVDRITQVSPLGETAQAHEPPDEMWQTSVAHSDKASVWVEEDTLWLAEYHHGELIGPSQGLYRIDIPVVTPAWFIRLLLALGPAVKKVEPASYRESACQIARQTLDAYQ
ncbi:MAG: WYL domain-containing protein [Propionibacteriaceae bacterium]|nr:WYL domain-containing protein [Propionibacteriaceae bacterium]